MAVVIEMKNVSFVAQNRFIVRDFSHQFEEGKTTALVGPSGSGKSTVLKLSAGLLVPTSGEVSFRGRDIFYLDRKETLGFRREGAMVFQDSALWANQTLYQCLDLPLRIHFPEMSARERENRIRAMLDEVGYKRDLSVRPSALSMGEQKLIAFARAMICRPALLYLDEWTESLDDSSAQRLVQLVRRQQREAHTVIFVSHDFRIIKSLADYVLMILGGRFFLKFSRQQMEEDEDLSRYVERGIAS
ncbi:MAG: ATP-binding cassette domain-containing protein [Treponema sp.]|jgi:ABC-type multidrug transport system ATPase subunit|nr:ATP-binding cassette domain-containing protein [Treponema sp.]